MLGADDGGDLLVVDLVVVIVVVLFVVCFVTTGASLGCVVDLDLVDEYGAPGIDLRLELERLEALGPNLVVEA